MCKGNGANGNGENGNRRLITDVIINELNNLREELHNLKNCQFLFLRLSVTSTATIIGALIALEAKVKINNPYFSLAFLSPLIIIVPCWLIFLDKAITISRIVGYYRILERVLIQIVTNDSSYTTAQGYRYIGWENALREFRNMFAQRSSVRYRIITFFTFAIQGLICIESAVYLFVIKEHPIKIGIFLFLSFIIYVACVVFLIFLPLLHQLYHGSYTYSENERRWLQILYH